MDKELDLTQELDQETLNYVAKQLCNLSEMAEQEECATSYRSSLSTIIYTCDQVLQKNQDSRISLIRDETLISYAMHISQVHCNEEEVCREDWERGWKIIESQSRHLTCGCAVNNHCSLGRDRTYKVLSVCCNKCHGYRPRKQDVPHE